MATPREVLRVPRLRGIHDFPEKAPVGSAAEALNVEFVDGGVSRRRGSEHIRNIAIAPGPRIVGKGLWSWRDHSGAIWHIVAYVDHAAAAQRGKAYIQIAPQGGAPIATFDLSARLAGGVTWEWPARNGVVWTATEFQPSGQTPALLMNAFVVATEHPIPDAPVPGEAASLWAIYPSKGGIGGFGCTPIGPLDRDGDDPAHPGDNRYWAGAHYGVPSEASSDDRGPYYGALSSTDEDFEKGRDRDVVGGRLVTTYRGRLVVSGRAVYGDPHMLLWSNLGDMKTDIVANNRDGNPIQGVVQGFPAHNFVHLVDEDQTPITAMTTWNDYLVVFKERSIRMLRFSGIEDLQVLQQSYGLGHVAKGPPVKVRHRSKDLLFFVSDDGIYAWNGQADYVSGPVEKRIQKRGLLREAIGFHHQQAGQVWWLVGRGGGNTPRWFVLDLDSGDWSEMEYGGDFDCCGLLDMGSNPPWPHVIGADQSGVHSLNLAKMDVGGSDGTHDATAPFQSFEARWESQRLAYGRHQVRRWRHLRVDQEQADGAADLTVWWALDNQDRATQVLAGGQKALMSMQPGAPGTFGNLTFGNALFAAGEGQYFSSRVDLFSGGPGRWFRFGFESSSASGPRWHVTSAEVDTRRLEGRR